MYFISGKLPNTQYGNKLSPIYRSPNQDQEERNELCRAGEERSGPKQVKRGVAQDQVKRGMAQEQVKRGVAQEQVKRGMAEDQVKRLD